MINFEYANRFCKDNIALIENYEQAMSDETQTWHCHHRLETDFGLLKDKLKEQGLYYHRSASELIFLTNAEHIRLHQTERMKDPTRRQRISDSQSERMKDPINRKNLSEKQKKRFEDPKERKKVSEQQKKRFEDPKERKKVSDNFKGEKNPNYGTHPTWMNNGIVCVFPKTQEEIEHYRELGYIYGRLPFRK
jgi:hypothetical protein